MSFVDINMSQPEIAYTVLNEHKSSKQYPVQTTVISNDCCKFRTSMQSPCPACKRIRKESVHCSINNMYSAS